MHLSLLHIYTFLIRTPNNSVCVCVCALFAYKEYRDTGEIMYMRVYYRFSRTKPFYYTVAAADTLSTVLTRTAVHAVCGIATGSRLLASDVCKGMTRVYY